MENLSATETAFLLIACQQLVLGAGWLASVRLLALTRRAALYWAAYGALGALALVTFVVSVRPGTEPLRALGNVAIVLAMVCLQRGVRAFFGAPSPWGWHAGTLAFAVVVAFSAMLPQQTAWRVAVVCALLTALCCATALDMRRALRGRLRPPGALLLLTAPLLLAGVVFSARGLRATFWPQTIIAEVMNNSALNVTSAFVQGLVALTLHLALMGLVIARLVGDLQRASRHDALTGLLNRGAMDELLSAETRRAHRLGEPFCVLMIDVDHFKAINDAHGHAAGDRALQHLGSLLSTQMRDIDRVARWGGEEFVVLMPGTVLEAAATLAERLRERAEAVPSRWLDGPLPVALSVGVAQWHPGDDDPSALVARADAALYRAKAAGRNRVELQRSPVEAVPIGGAAA
jgi:diguanylate cyclase (GGDEF)-like protein